MAVGLSLHIGINRVDPNHYAGWSGPLNACENDARSMQQIATAAGFQTEIRLTQQATRSAVANFLTGAANRLRSGDILLVTYSGHGSQIRDISGDEEDSQDETWCLYDGQMLDDELYRFYGALAEGVRVLVLSDSCHSGTVTRATFYEMAISAGLAGVLASRDFGKPGTPAKTYSAKFLPPDVAQRTYAQNERFYESIGKAAKGGPAGAKGEAARASIRLISGCQDNQLSYDGAINGVFTAALLQAWDSGRFRGNYSDFHLRIQRMMLPTQSPNHFKVGSANLTYDRQKPFTI